MGLDNGVPQTFFGYLKEKMAEAYDSFDAKQITDEQLPDDYRPDTTIWDVTPCIRKFLKKEDYPFRAKSKALEIKQAVIESLFTTDINSFLFMETYKDLSDWIFLIDTPQNVVAIKAVEHEKRTEDFPPYTDNELIQLDILKDKETGRLDPAFGSTSIWADNFDRMWNTKILKPVVGQFFCECLARALLGFKKQQGRVNQIQFIVEGAWPNENKMVRSQIGSCKMLHECFVPLSQPTAGEVDIKFLSYITSCKKFVLRSDDGDWLCLSLLHLLRLVLEGCEISDLPEIWIDRTVNWMVLTGKHKAMFKFNNPSFIFKALGEMIAHSDQEELEDDPSKIMQLLAESIISLVGLFLLRGADFVGRFQDLYLTAKEQEAEQEERRGGGGAGGDISFLFTSVSNRSVISAAEAARNSKEAPKKKKTKAPPYFSAKKLITKLYTSPKWSDTFLITKQDRLITSKIDSDAFRKCIQKCLKIDESTHPLQDSRRFVQNVEKLETTLDYWLNANVRMDNVAIASSTKDVDEAKPLPYRFQYLELDEEKKRPKHGFKLVACRPEEIVENSTHQFYIDLDDQSIRPYCLRDDDEYAKVSTIFRVE